MKTNKCKTSRVKTNKCKISRVKTNKCKTKMETNKRNYTHIYIYIFIYLYISISDIDDVINMPVSSILVSYCISYM